MFSTYYNAAIRKLVVGFGSLFDNIVIQRTNRAGDQIDRIRVPLAYGPSEKFLMRLDQPSSINEEQTSVQITLPRMSFEITAISYDSGRVKNRLNQTWATPSSDGTTTFSYSEVPYNVTFSLYAMVRNMDDGFQIMEQVLPLFSPDFNIRINFTDLFKKVDVPIILNDVTLAEDYDGDFETRRNILLTFDFTAKTYVYGPEKSSNIITDATIRSWDYNLGKSGAYQFFQTGISGDISGFTAGQTYDTYQHTYEVGNYGVTGAIDTYGNYIGPTFGSTKYKSFVVDRRPFYSIDLSVGNKGIEAWRMTSDATQITNPGVTSGSTADPQDAIRTLAEITLQREYERGFRRFSIRGAMGSRTSNFTGNGVPSASWSAGDPNLGTWSDKQNIATVKSSGATLEYVFTTTGKRKSVDVTAATADRQQSFINFLKPWIDSKAAAGDPVQVYVYDGYQLAFHDTAQTDPAKGNLAMVLKSNSGWSGDTKERFPIPDFSKSSHIEFRENEVIPWRDEVGIHGFMVDAASNAGDTAGNYGIPRAPGYFEFYRDRGLDIIGEAVPMIQGAGGTYDLNPDLYKLTPYVGYGGGTADGLAGNFWGNRNWRTVFPSTTDSEIHMVVQWTFQGAPGGINSEYWNGATYDFAGITAEIKQAHDNGFIVDAGFGPYLSASPAEEAKRSIVLDYIVELGGSAAE